VINRDLILEQLDDNLKEANRTTLNRIDTEQVFNIKFWKDTFLNTNVD